MAGGSNANNTTFPSGFGYNIFLPARTRWSCLKIIGTFSFPPAYGGGKRRDFNYFMVRPKFTDRSNSYT
ncbi:MAG: hypothetical protein LBR79_01315 [Oscillospiraceae bacterium]|nr:hypothetical protein [Oscillospiraceae bacterium]